MIILEDKAQQEGKHYIKGKWFADNGILVERVPLPVGDYIVGNDKTADVIVRKSSRGLDLKKMDFLGTYAASVDTKEHIQEIIGNVSGKSHERFRDECILAKNNGIKLYILIENIDGVTCIQDLFSWHNPRLDIFKNSTELIGYYRNGSPRYKRVQRYPTATKGSSLAKTLLTMQLKYGVAFLFCKPSESGKKILELLGVDRDGKSI